MRRSHQVALVLLGATGVVGLAVAYDAWRSAAADAGTTTVAPALVPVRTDQMYANNDYIAGVGYYHAPYHAWFPHPFNYYDPARGYFAGGLWQALPWAVALARSQPSGSAVAAALAAQREQQERQARPPGFSGGGYAGGFSSACPGFAPPPAPRPGVLRGGFGFSAHPAGA